MGEFEELLKKFEDPEKITEPENDRSSILIIDDDESIRRSLSRIFRKRYKVLTAEDGRKGLELLTTQIYCVVLDVKMKGWDGFATYPKLKDKCPDALITFYTAFQSEHDLRPPHHGPCGQGRGLQRRNAPGHRRASQR